MKKHHILTLVLLFTATAAQAQFYNAAALGNGGQTSFFVGVENTMSTPVFYHWVENPYWSYEELTPTSVTHHPSFSLLVSGNGMHNTTEYLKLGMSIGLGVSLISFDADFKAATIGGIYDYQFGVKSKLFNLQLGVDGEVLPIEKIGIQFSVAPYVQFLFGGKTMGQKFVAATGTLIEDAAANEWHDVEKNDFDMPNADLGIVGRLGVNYHFTEVFFAGIAAQMRFPIFNIGESEFSNIYKGLDYGFDYAETKRKSWAVLLTLGVNIE